MVLDRRGINLIGEERKMRLFLTIEGQNCTENGLATILQQTIVELSFLTSQTAISESSCDYGTEFQLISIIPSCMDDTFWSAIGWKERKLIRRKNREADIRLRMDYNADKIRR